MNLLRIEEDLSEAHLRLAQTQIENLSWQKCIKKYDRVHTLTYLDPPYYGTEGYGSDFNLEQYDEMADIIGSIKGNAVVSVNDIPEMRKAFKGFKMKHVNITYTVGGGAKKATPQKELIITNF